MCIRDLTVLYFTFVQQLSINLNQHESISSTLLFQVAESDVYWWGSLSAQANLLILVAFSGIAISALCLHLSKHEDDRKQIQKPDRGMWLPEATPLQIMWTSAHRMSCA
jgi:hypothetical protein